MTTPGEINEISYELGSLKQGLDMVLKTLSEDRLAAAQHRTDLKRKLDEHDDRMQRVEAALQTTVSSLGGVLPKLANLEQRALISDGRHKERSGIYRLLGGIGYMLSSIFGGVIALAVERFLHLK